MLTSSRGGSCFFEPLSTTRASVGAVIVDAPHCSEVSDTLISGLYMIRQFTDDATYANKRMLPYANNQMMLFLLPLLTTVKVKVVLSISIHSIIIQYMDSTWIKSSVLIRIGCSCVKISHMRFL